MSEFELITTETQLNEICEQFKASKQLALDTEFKRETSYYPIPCLIQIAAEQKTVLIDPFPIEDFTALKKLLCDNSSCKILHSGRQDLEVFHLLFDCIPSPIFDTQIAAALLGKAHQIGYSALVNEYFNVELDKTLTRTDWEKRPLSEKELIYAANDVKFLEVLYQRQAEELEQKNRLNWLREEVEFLFHETMHDDSLEKVWKKISRSYKFNSKQRNILFALNQWREQEARTRNRARQFIISNEVLMSLAISAPQTTSTLNDIDKIPAPVVRRYGDILLDIINSQETQALNIEEDNIGRLSPEENTLAKALKKIIKQVASELDIEDNILCNRKTLEATARGNYSTRLFSGWRYEVIGKQLEDYIQSH
ncbi:MAG: ribonuclease D [Gammaproteobacteria bacterium]|nr:ribonuclease D [Gammaproteobacteria bacterium]